MKLADVTCWAPTPVLRFRHNTELCAGQAAALGCAPALSRLWIQHNCPDSRASPSTHPVSLGRCPAAKRYIKGSL